MDILKQDLMEASDLPTRSHNPTASRLALHFSRSFPNSSTPRVEAYKSCFSSAWDDRFDMSDVVSTGDVFSSRPIRRPELGGMITMQ